MHKLNIVTNFWKWVFTVTFVGSAVAYAWWSYILVDPNLVLSSWAPYWQAQQWLWETFLPNREILTEWYEVAVGGVILSYLGLLWTFRRQHWRWWMLAIILIPLFFAHNALSHDVYNYIFNAKMVVKYQANPHVQVALDFPNDPYVRFMHNVHTPAPYGYGWTAISVIPYVAGLGKFLTEWMSFRLMSVFSYLALIVTVWWAKKRTAEPFETVDVLALLLNPLLLIEIISNSHNDLWMMVPAMLSLFLVGTQSKLNMKVVTLSSVLLTISISTKFATALLLPVWVLLIAKSYLPGKWQQFTQLFWPAVASLLLIIPLLTPRSQQFHPWYLTWALVWLPFIKVKNLRYFLVLLSFTALYRYVPWLLSGEYTPDIIHQQKLITWLPAVVGGVIFLFQSRLVRKALNDQQVA